MWYASFMPNELPTDVLDAAGAAVIFAQQVRRMYRRRTDKNSEQRNSDIELALTRLRESMQPVRSAIGRFPYGPQTSLAEANRNKIRAASVAIQRERRKLWKMRKNHQEV